MRDVDRDGDVLTRTRNALSAGVAL